MTTEQAAALVQQTRELHRIVGNAHDLDDAETNADIIVLATSILFNAVHNDPNTLRNEIQAFLATTTDGRQT